jgi:hypothetical protein
MVIQSYPPPAMAANPGWLLLIHQVPPKPDYLRVKIRRRLQQAGSVAVKDEALAAIGEIVHDLDIKDEKYERPETAGIEQVITGIAMAHKADEARIERGSAVLDDLHACLSRKATKRTPRRNK